jgi:hypothetical protein
MMGRKLLSDDEKRDFTRLERMIERAGALDLERAYALRDIRAARYYRLYHNNFNTYCQARWDISGAVAKNLITAANVMEAIKDGPACRMVPETVAQAIQLGVGLRGRWGNVNRGFVAEHKALIQEAWQEVLRTGRGRITAAFVRSVVARQRPTVSDRQEKVTRTIHICRGTSAFIAASRIATLYTSSQIDELIFELREVSLGHQQPAERKTNDNYASAV